MDKKKLKKLLDSYKFDSKYIAEKVTELEHINAQNKRINNFMEENQGFKTIDTQLDDKVMEQLLTKKQCIEFYINSLDQPYKTVMYLKYLCFYTFDQIANDMSYSTKRIYQLHSEAMDKLLKNFNKDNITSF